jgi:hypothetical protein
MLLERVDIRLCAADGKRLLREERVGASFTHDTNTWNYLHRLLDKENNWYLEEVVDVATGNLLRSCSEPLTEHRGHGSAKSAEVRRKKKQNPKTPARLPSASD